MDVHAERITGHVDKPHSHVDPLTACDAREMQDRRLRLQAMRAGAAHARVPVGRLEERVPERSSLLVRELRGERYRLRSRHCVERTTEARAVAAIATPREAPVDT